jgi:hypothetical protein
MVPALVLGSLFHIAFYWLLSGNVPPKSANFNLPALASGDFGVKRNFNPIFLIDAAH